MKIFVISLKNATARRNSAIEQLGRYGLKFSFFDAIENVADPSQHFSDFSRSRYWLNSRRDPLPGEIGCFASHRSLWKACVELNQPILILEDDFRLETSFPEAFELLETLANTFGYIRLQSSERRRATLKRLRHATHRVGGLRGFQIDYLSDVPLCMLGYAISPIAAASLLNASSTLTAPVDKFIQRVWEHETPIFGLQPAVIAPSTHAAESTIGDRPKKSRNASLLVRRLLYKGQGELHRISFDLKQLRMLGIRPAKPIPVNRPRGVEKDSLPFNVF